jgi:hypothetical protein
VSNASVTRRPGPRAADYPAHVPGRPPDSWSRAVASWGDPLGKCDADHPRVGPLAAGEREVDALDARAVRLRIVTLGVDGGTCEFLRLSLVSAGGREMGAVSLSVAKTRALSRLASGAAQELESNARAKSRAPTGGR